MRLLAKGVQRGREKERGRATTRYLLRPPVGIFFFLGIALNRYDDLIFYINLDISLFSLCILFGVP